MRKIIKISLLTISLVCVTCNKASTKEEIKRLNNETNHDCSILLNKLFKTSSFKSDENYHVRVDEIRNDTIIIKAFVENNLSEIPKEKMIVESALGWFIIPFKEKILYYSLNALDPLEPKFEELNFNKKLMDDFLICQSNAQKQNNMNITDNIFGQMFNESSNIEFEPTDLNKNEPETQSFKVLLEQFNRLDLYKKLNINDLSILINNETFITGGSYIDSSWLRFFLDRISFKNFELNDLMHQAIEQEDLNAVKIFIDKGYIVSSEDVNLSIERKMEIDNQLKQSTKNGPFLYDNSKSYRNDICNLLKYMYLLNKIQDPDGYTNLRKERNTQSEVLQQIKSGEKIEVLNNEGSWWLVKTKEGKQGYVYYDRIKIKE
jgi:hypothetical protein